MLSNYLIKVHVLIWYLTEWWQFTNFFRAERVMAFTLHDSVILHLDFASEDKDLIKSIIAEYRNTKLGNFKTTVSAGKDLYNINKINI